MAIKLARVFSHLPIPPGAALAEELEARGITQPELAARLNRPAQTIDEIVGASRPSPKALRLP